MKQAAQKNPQINLISAERGESRLRPDFLVTDAIPQTTSSLGQLSADLSGFAASVRPKLNTFLGDAIWLDSRSCSEIPVLSHPLPAVGTESKVRQAAFLQCGGNRISMATKLPGEQNGFLRSVVVLPWELSLSINPLLGGS